LNHMKPTAPQERSDETVSIRLVGMELDKAVFSLHKVYRYGVFEDLSVVLLDRPADNSEVVPMTPDEILRALLCRANELSPPSVRMVGAYSKKAMEIALDSIIRHRLEAAEDMAEWIEGYDPYVVGNGIRKHIDIDQGMALVKSFRDAGEKPCRKN
jgi:aminopeptidase N